MLYWLFCQWFAIFAISQYSSSFGLLSKFVFIRQICKPVRFMLCGVFVIVKFHIEKRKDGLFLPMNCKNLLENHHILHVCCMSIHLLVCAPIILSVCQLFCPSVYPSVHLYLCSHIAKIAKSIEKFRKINLKSMKQSNWNKLSIKEKNIEKKIALKSRIVVRTNLLFKDPGAP